MSDLTNWDRMENWPESLRMSNMRPDDLAWLFGLPRYFDKVPGLIRSTFPITVSDRGWRSGYRSAQTLEVDITWRDPEEGSILREQGPWDRRQHVLLRTAWEMDIQNVDVTPASLSQVLMVSEGTVRSYLKIARGNGFYIPEGGTFDPEKLIGSFRYMAIDYFLTVGTDPDKIAIMTSCSKAQVNRFLADYMAVDNAIQLDLPRDMIARITGVPEIAVDVQKHLFPR